MYQKISRFLLATGTMLLTNLTITNPVVAEAISLDSLCLKFPLNSRCRDSQYIPPLGKAKVNQYQLNRDTFCAAYAFNSHCLEDPVEIINFNLQDEEWIRIRKSGNQIQLVHSERNTDAFISLMTGQIDSLIPLPGLLDILPLGILDVLPLDLNQYYWQDHQVTQITFKCDRSVNDQMPCKADNCLIVGKNTIDLPDKTNFYQGLFTVEYQEENLLRSVTFRIPPDVTISPIETITIQVTDGILDGNK